MIADQDARLVAGVLGGDADAARALYRPHWPASWRAAQAIWASAALAEEAAQDGWIRALRALERYDAARPFGPWLRRIVVRCALDAVRRERAGRVVHGLAALHAVADGPETADDALVDAVLRLPPERRAVVALRFWADLSVPEIADALEIPEGTARSRLARALDELRSMPEVRRRTSRRPSGPRAPASCTTRPRT